MTARRSLWLRVRNADTAPLERLALAGITLVLCAVFLVAHAHYPALPSPGAETGGWRAWNDQGRYIEAARAWAAWDLTPARHWYLPGYALMASLFLGVTPHDRFLIPNLGCLIAGEFACAALARRMFPQFRVASLIGAGAFVVASVGTMHGLKSWLIPWTTTPAAAVALLALVAVLRLAERPGIGRAILAGGAIGAITLFRPSDAVPVAVAAGLVMLPCLFAMPLRRAAGVALAALLGAAAMTIVACLLIAATSGFGVGSYFAASAEIGFEFRLLPLRWVTLIVDPRPLLDGVGAERVEPGLHRGAAQIFPWMITGLAGAAACCVGPGGRRVHVLLAVWLAAQLALVLSYRDLHILGFWLYGNYHYLKVTQPILLLFTLTLPFCVVRQGRVRWRACGAALAAVVLAFGWRAALVPAPGAALLLAAEIALPDLSRLDAADIVSGRGDWQAFYAGAHRLRIGGAVFHHNVDFKLYPRAGDFLVVPLRRLPPGEGVLVPAEGLHVDAQPPPRAMRQAIEFGLPCAFGLAGDAVCGSAGVPLIAAR